MVRFVVLLLLALNLWAESLQQLSDVSCSRRSVLRVLAASPALAFHHGASASAEVPPEREALLQAISKGSDEPAVLRAIENLLPSDPSKGKLDESLLDGEWNLLWSAKAEAFSPLLQLPKPFAPSSYQYFGAVAETEVGPNRVAQGLTGGILGTKQLWLSSGVEFSQKDSSSLTILPPFRLQVGSRPGLSPTAKQTLVEAGSDAEFRANPLNSRTLEAQQAPRNEYQQLYVESGGAGSLRISTIRSGDPVIVGAIFVHEKL